MWSDFFLVLFVNIILLIVIFCNKVLIIVRFYLVWLLYSVNLCDSFNFEIVPHERAFLFNSQELQDTP